MFFFLFQKTPDTSFLSLCFRTDKTQRGFSCCSINFIYEESQDIKYWPDLEKILTLELETSLVKVQDENKNVLPRVHWELRSSLRLTWRDRLSGLLPAGERLCKTRMEEVFLNFIRLWGSSLCFITYSEVIDILVIIEYCKGLIILSPFQTLSHPCCFQKAR